MSILINPPLPLPSFSRVPFIPYHVGTNRPNPNDSTNNRNDSVGDLRPSSFPSNDTCSGSSAVKLTTLTSIPRIEEPVILSGWLYKMKRKSTVYAGDWNRRWVVIQNEAISWKHSKESTEMVAGSIELSNIHRVYRIEPLTNNQRINKQSSSNRRKKFVIKSKTRSLCLMARSEEECDLWMRALQLQLDLKDGGTSSGPSGTKNRRKSNGGLDKYDQMMKAIAKNTNCLKAMDEDLKEQIVNSNIIDSDDDGDVAYNEYPESEQQNKEEESNIAYSECDQYNKDKESNIVKDDDGPTSRPRSMIIPESSINDDQLNSNFSLNFFTKVRTSRGDRGIENSTNVSSDSQDNHHGWQSDSSSDGNYSDIETLILE